MKLFPLLALVVLGLAPCGAWASPASEESDIANNLARQGCYDTAVMFYEKALRLNPGFGPAIAGRAAALRKLAHPGSAMPTKAAKGKKGARTNEERAAETAARAQAQAAESAARAKTLAAEAAVRAQAQEANAAKRAAQVAAAAAAAAAKPKPVAATAPAKSKQAKQAAVAAAKPKPIAAVTPPKPKPIAAVSAPKAKPIADVTAANQTPPIAAVTAPKAKPVAALAAPKPKPVAAVAAIPTQTHTDAVLTPAKPLSVVATVKPAVDHVSTPDPLGARRQAAPAPRAQGDRSNSSSVAVPSNVGSAPPMSAMSDDSARSAASDKVPGWLIGMAVGTFLLLVVLAISWLSPTLSASRQLHDRLKGLERTREER